MANARIILDTRGKNENDLCPLKLSVTHKETRFLGINISVLKEQWSGEEVINHPKAKIYNSVVKAKLVHAENIILRLTATGELASMNVNKLRAIIESGNDNTPETSKTKLLDHFGYYISNARSNRTKELYQDTANKIEAFLGRNPDFSEINLSWLKSFDKHLSESCKTLIASIGYQKGWSNSVSCVLNSLETIKLMKYIHINN